MTFPLRPFQASDTGAIIDGGKDTRHAALWWDPGLGKSLATIAIAHARGIAGGALGIVCPAHLCLTWAAEWRKWTRASLPFITSYQMAAKDPKCLEGRAMLVADEAHALKRRESKRSQALVPAFQRAPFALLLSGTPAPNGRPVELFTAGSIVCPDRLRAAGIPDFRRYVATFCGPGVAQGDYRGTTLGNLPLLRSCFAGRAFSRSKAVCLPELPPIQYRNILLPKTAEVEEACQALARRVDAALEESGQTFAGSPALWMDKEPEDILSALASVEGLGAYAELSRIFAEAKAAGAAAHVAECLAGGETRLVVFGTHRGLLAAIGRACETEGARVGYLWGGVSRAVRQAEVEEFQGDSPRPHVLCCNYDAAGTGLTLTAASHCILAELPWTPGTLDQGPARLHRIGQRGSVLVDCVCVAGTLDEWRAGKIDSKRLGVQRLTGMESP